MSKNNQKISYSSTQGELFSLSPVQGKQIVVDFDSPEVSSLGGLLLMRESKLEDGEYCYMSLLIFEGISGKMI